MPTKFSKASSKNIQVPENLKISPKINTQKETFLKYTINYKIHKSWIFTHSLKTTDQLLTYLLRFKWLLLINSSST